MQETEIEMEVRATTGVPGDCPSLLHEAVHCFRDVQNNAELRTHGIPMPCASVGPTITTADVRICEDLRRGVEIRSRRDYT